MKNLVGTIAKYRTLLAEKVSQKGARYWITATLVLLVSLFAQPYIEMVLPLAEARYSLFESLAGATPRPLMPRYVKTVLIGDDEFWHGPPAGRRPLNRAYLAEMIDILDGANAKAIALDIDLRSPDPGTSQIAPEYLSETHALIEKIIAIAAHRRVILARTIWYGEGKDAKLDSDIFNSYGICTKIGDDGQWENPGTPERFIGRQAGKNISCGYVALPGDMRLIPGRLPLGDGKFIDSFALAITRVQNPRLAENIDSAARFGSYIPQNILRDQVQFNASAVMRRNQETLKSLQSEIVIVGGAWSSLAYERGRPVDLYLTPIGFVPGALIHANFAEAMLDSRTFFNTPHWVMKGLEIIFSVLAALLFALVPKPSVMIVTLFVCTLVLVGLQWIVLHMLGFLLESLVPLVGLWSHAFLERLFDRGAD
jgi:CHASE2 domain-containing sensor protein